MSLIIALVLGAIIGWLGARIAGREEGVFGSIAIGVVGAIIGGALAQLFGSGTGYLSLTWPSLLWALIGAIILSVILNAVQRRSTHTHI
jgi:uncharacterized membrane protein YeaQ/YmgE (transglycosylase-associated protein family)